MKIDLELKSIGPHAETHLAENVKALNTVIFTEMAPEEKKEKNHERHQGTIAFLSFS